VQQKFLYPLSRLIIRTFAFLMLRFDVQHQGTLPPGPKLFVANHPSATDPFLIHLVSKEEMNVLITEKAFRVPVLGWFLRKVNEIPVPPEQSSTALEQACCHLQQGKSVMIFIEGHISPEDGGFLPPRTGAARLALSARVPVVPVGIYLRRSWRINIRSGISGEQSEAFWYLHGPYAITVGQPLYLHGNAEDREYVRSLSERIMTAIRGLTTESETRGYGLMKSSLLVTIARLLVLLRRKGVTALL
jgi:1-acyl-sn-glycerol-3-phosphate acyltransferase